MKKTCLVIVVSLNALLCPAYGENGRKDSALKELKANTEKLVASTAALEAKTNLQRQENAAKKQAVEPAPPKPQPQPSPVAERLVNILLIDPVGLTIDCYKEVRMADVTQRDGHIHFLYDGKPIDWDKKVAQSCPYRLGDPTYEVYLDSDGEIWWENPEGGYSHVQKGRYITTRNITVSP